MADTLSPRTENLLAGRLSREDIPYVKANVIRIYLCSTGTDSLTERDAFLVNVYPRLRTFCKEKYGLEFQVVDLNWGLSPDSMDNRTDLTPVRIREIQKCQALSAGPCFIALIGQKYGPRSLPDVILPEDFDTIQVALRSHKGRATKNAPLLDQCYLLDENNIPPVYILKDKTTLVPEFSDNDVELHQAAEMKWQTLQAELQNLIHKGAELACLHGSMNKETAERFFLSELENQILLGVEASEQPNKRCVLITRNIVDLHNYTEEPMTPKFAEVKYNSRNERYELDQESANMLVKLKNRVVGLVSEANTIHHDVLWRYEDVIHPELHKEYLDSLCEKLYSTCVRLIQEGVQVPDEELPGSCDEAVQHWRRCRYLACNFHNQVRAMTRLREYVTGTLSTPLVVYGASGSGKSKIISKLAFEMEDVLSGDYMVVLRYLGLTPTSVDLRQVLISLCTQVAMAMGEPVRQVRTDMTKLVKLFSEVLESVPSSSRLVIILDGLDQLLPDHMVWTLSWIPLILPSNVKLIITVLDTAHSLLDRLRDELLSDSPESFVEITPIGVNECEELFLQNLSVMNRTLTQVQKETFRSTIEREPLPLFVELLANIAKDVNSFTDVEDLHLPNNCQDGILNLFEKLEAKHGKLFMSRACASIVASSTGLSDCEMEDLLSLDEDVLEEVFQEFCPSVKRIPCIKWLSLKQDIEGFLTYRDADGVTVAAWQHDSFDDVVNRRYLSDATVAARVHSNIADYFLGSRVSLSKPVIVSNDNKQLTSCPSNDRKVSSQPRPYGGKYGSRLNRRMYEQVPRHLELGGRFQELDSLVLFNYEWLYNKMKALSLQHVLADFALNPSSEASLVEAVLRASENIIERDINNLPAEITGHLLPYYASHPNIRSLIRQCDIQGLKHCAVAPNFSYQQFPGGSLQFTLNCPSDVEHLLLIHEDRYLVCKKRDDPYVYSFDLETSEQVSTVFVSIGDLHATPNGKYFIIVDHVTEKAIKIHEAETGDFITQIILMNHIEGKTSLYKKGPLCVTNDRLCAIVTLTNSVLCICDIPSGNVLNIIPLDGKSSLCNITPNGRQVFCNSNSYLLAFDVYTQVHLLTIPLGRTPSKITFTDDGLRAFLSNNMDTKVTVMHLNGDVIDFTYMLAFDEKMPGDKILDLKVSPDDSLLLVCGKKTLVVQHRGLEKVIAVFQKPEDLPEELKRPRTDCAHFHFTNSDFTRDSNYVVGTIFRDVYVWEISSGSLVSVIRGHIGPISTMLVSKSRNQVITHKTMSKDIQIWNITEDVPQVNPSGKLADAISEFQLAADNRFVFVKCRYSNKLGVIDMRTGSLFDLLSHDSAVEDFAVSPDGTWVLVSTTPRLKGTAFKLWNIEDSRSVLETGDVAGHSVGMNSLHCIIMVAQKADTFRAPYFITVFYFANTAFRESTSMETSVLNVRSKPFVTYSDQYMIINSTLNSDTSGDTPLCPCLYIFCVEQGMQMFTWDATNMNFEEHLLDILEVRPCRQQNENIIAAIFSCKDHSIEVPARTIPATINSSAGNLYGFFLLDVSTSSLTLLCIPFPKPSYGVNGHPLVFSADCCICLTDTSSIFHVPSGEFIGQVTSDLTPPRAFALLSTVVLYYRDTVLLVVRVSNAAVIASCDVHAPICHIHVCSDDRTVLVGCKDGTVLAYTIIDPERDDVSLILNSIPSRVVGEPEILDKRPPRPLETRQQNGYSAYSLPSSATTLFSRDVSLEEMKTISRDWAESATLTSPTSSIM